MKVALIAIASVLGSWLAVASAQGSPQPSNGNILRPLGDWNSIPISGEAGCLAGSNCDLAWQNIVSNANRTETISSLSGTDGLMNGNSDHDVIALANALLWRGRGDTGTPGRTKARDYIAQIIADPIVGGSALAPSRNLAGYVLAADTMNLKNFDPALDSAFRAWIELVSEGTDWEGDGCCDTGGVLGSFGSFENYAKSRPNNIGIYAGASRLAVDIYLDHGMGHIADQASVFRGFIGSSAHFQGFLWGNDLSWQAGEDSGVYRGINPALSTKEKRSSPSTWGFRSSCG